MVVTTGVSFQSVEDTRFNLNAEKGNNPFLLDGISNTRDSEIRNSSSSFSGWSGWQFLLILTACR
jgi:hypothetical protein